MQKGGVRKEKGRRRKITFNAQRSTLND